MLGKGIHLALCNKRNLRHQIAKEHWFGSLLGHEVLCWAQFCPPVDHSQWQQCSYLKRNKQELFSLLRAFWYAIKMCCKPTKCSGRASCPISDNTITLDGLHLSNTKWTGKLTSILAYTDLTFFLLKVLLCTACFLWSYRMKSSLSYLPKSFYELDLCSHFVFLAGV